MAKRGAEGREKVEKIWVENSEKEKRKRRNGGEERGAEDEKEGGK